MIYMQRYTLSLSLSLSLSPSSHPPSPFALLFPFLLSLDKCWQLSQGLTYTSEDYSIDARTIEEISTIELFSLYFFYPSLFFSPSSWTPPPPSPLPSLSLLWFKHRYLKWMKCLWSTEEGQWRGSHDEMMLDLSSRLTLPLLSSLFLFFSFSFSFIPPLPPSPLFSSLPPPPPPPPPPLFLLLL